MDEPVESARLNDRLCEVLFHGERVAAPNDPKLSDGGGWRAGCAVGERRRPEAASVTAGAVRCSAWFGDVGLRSWKLKIGNSVTETIEPEKSCARTPFDMSKLCLNEFECVDEALK